MLKRLCLCGSNSQTYKLGSNFKKTPQGPVVIELKRQEGSFGFAINGGVEEDKLIIVTAADTSKKLIPGDIILSVNGVSVTGCSVPDVTSLIGACGDELKLEVLPTKFGHGKG